MLTTIRMRTLLRFTIALSYWLQARHLVQAVNITVADTDPAIQYQPEEWWFSSTNLCSTCLNPGLSSSFHEGVNPISLGLDSDDNTTTNPPPSTATPPPPASNTQVVNPITSPPTTPSTTTPPDPDATSDSDPDSHKSKGSKRSLNMALVQRLDTDDLPANQTVTLSYNFTGSAVYLFAAQLPSTIGVNATSSNMNITVFIDNASFPSVVASSQAATSVPGQLVFSQSGLVEGLHQLVVQLGNNSTFVFDHLMYTTEADASTTPLSSPSPTANPTTKKHNIATFAGAVGGSVGVLGLFSLGLALSIIRRRHLAAKREARDHESLHTNASDDSPHMAGPAPFVPRYFPDTVIPQDPPTYMAALATNHNNSTLLAVLPAAAFGSTQRSYADIPPNMPPPPLEDIMIPPPPFDLDPPPPPPALPAGADDVDEGALPPSVAGAELPSHSAVPVGTEPPNAAPTPELVPLLQPALLDTRPRSRASARSVGADSSETEPTEITHLREDVS